MTPKVLTAPGKPSGGSASTAMPVSRVFLALGVIYLVGTLVDLGILWFGQRQAGLQWEFVALTNTVEAWPRLVLGLGMMYLGVYIGDVRAQWPYRVLSGSVLLLGVGALALGGLMALNYLQVRDGMPAESASIVNSSVLKTGILCGLYVLLLIPSGVMGLFGLKSTS